jgi:hypothetical protein
MSSPEPSADSNHTHVEVPYEHDGKEDDREVVADSPGEMSEAEGNGAAHVDDDEEESDEGSDEEEEDDDDDEEPALKYERIGGSVGDLLKKDSASALAISNKLMVRTHQIQTSYPYTIVYRHWERTVASCISSISRVNVSNRINRTKPP